MLRPWYLVSRKSNDEPWIRVSGTGFYSNAGTLIRIMLRKVRTNPETMYTILHRDEPE